MTLRTDQYGGLLGDARKGCEHIALDLLSESFLSNACPGQYPVQWPGLDSMSAVLVQE